MVVELMFLSIMASATHVHRKRVRLPLPVFIVRLLCITCIQTASLRIPDLNIVTLVDGS
jgi:hypothetical protein